MSKHFAPGPQGKFGLGCFAEFRDSPLELLQQCHRQYGDVVRLPLGLGMHCALIFHPRDLEQVFHGEQFGRSDLSMLFEPLAGGSMIIADGETWKQQRRKVAPTFTLARQRNLAHAVEKEAETLATRWHPNTQQTNTVDLQTELVSYAMKTLSIFLLGRTLKASEIQTIMPAWTESLICMNRRLSQPVPIPMFIPTRNNRNLNRSATSIRNVLLAITEENRTNPEDFDPHSLLSNLIAQCHQEQSNQHDLEIVQEIMGVFLAGFDTIASAMMWTMHFLSLHPTWQHLVREELQNCTSSLADVMDLRDTPILSRVFNESMRLMPPLWLVDRKCNISTELGGHTIPAGTNIITSPYVTHRSPTWWEQAEKFDPDRFLPEALALRPKYAHFPFGGGRMKCIGLALAALEIKALFRTVLTNMHIEPVEPNHIEIEPAFVLRTRRGLPVRVTPMPTHTSKNSQSAA
jgi:cytochrome P450